MTPPASATLIPDGRYTFQIGEQSFQIDPIDALQEIDRIVELRKNCVNYEHLDDFRQWLITTAGIELTRTQADWLMDHLRGEYLRGKAERAASLNSLLRGSSPSTLPA